MPQKPSCNPVTDKIRNRAIRNLKSSSTDKVNDLQLIAGIEVRLIKRVSCDDSGVQFHYNPSRPQPELLE